MRERKIGNRGAMVLSLCLVGVKIERMENGREKIGKILGGKCVWLE